MVLHVRLLQSRWLAALMVLQVICVCYARSLLRAVPSHSDADMLVHCPPGGAVQWEGVSLRAGWFAFFRLPCARPMLSARTMRPHLSSHLGAVCALLLKRVACLETPHSEPLPLWGVGSNTAAVAKLSSSRRQCTGTLNECGGRA